MSIINKQEIEHVAHLARLEIAEDKIEVFTEQMNNILEHISMLNKVDTDNVPPTYHVLPEKNVWREDVVKPSLPREEALANAPEQENGCFKVLKVIE
ncbi:MAG: Asp-tRNA(Asn)/Glu-tRNA(Gln) amidotransferase subunit GatC [bacterium]